MRANALDWVNFFLADVRGGMGAYVNVLLFTEANWTQATIGAVLTISGLIGVLAHPFIGDFIDQTRAKRLVIVAGVLLLSCSGLAIVLWPVVPVVIASDIAMAALGGLFAPTVAAMTLGMYNREDLAARVGRNAAFDRAGNIFIAAFFGIIGVALSQKAPFFFVPAFAALTIAAVLSIPARAIDNERARGAPASSAARARPPNWRVLLKYRPFLIFTAAATLFHFANAPMLPLVAQRLASANPGFESGFTSAAIIIMQGVTILAAMLVARANAWGRRPLLILAFAALPLRAGLCAWSDDAFWLLALQALDGLGGGFLEALLPLVLADVMTGTSHYSLARGALGAIQGVGGSLSQGVAGLIVTTAGYPSAFLAFAIVACVALAVIVAAMPETAQRAA